MNRDHLFMYVWTSVIYLGMYKQAFDKYRFDCHMCEQRCTACTSQANNCTACGLDSILKGSTCVAKCATNQWLDGENCRLCHRTCKTCSRGGPYNCVTCPKKALNNVEDRFVLKTFLIHIHMYQLCIPPEFQTHYLCKQQEIKLFCTCI